MSMHCVVQQNIFGYNISTNRTTLVCIMGQLITYPEPAVERKMALLFYVIIHITIRLARVHHGISWLLIPTWRTSSKAFFFCFVL